MANKPCILIDLNIILDVYQKRDPFYEASAGILALVETGQINGYIAAHSFPTLFYLIQKDKSATEAKALIITLLRIIKISLIDQETIEKALALDYSDFEDAVQMICALQCKADFLITRNIKDYQPALVPVLEPIDFLNAF